MHLDPGPSSLLLLAMLPVLSLAAGERAESEPPASSSRLASQSMSRESRWAWSAILVGVVVRVWQYGLNRSLWVDEACCALNLIHRQYAELLRPLDYHQGAPLGFLFVERFRPALGS